jgi:hypothetical protein
MMADDIDDLLGAAALTPPADFAQRIIALARTMPQRSGQSRSLRPWQWASLVGGAGLGALVLCEFVFFAFLAASAQ